MHFFNFPFFTKKTLQNISFCSLISIPFSPTDWQMVSFDGTPHHTYELNNNELNISVNKSASPLIYKMKAPVKVKSFKVSGFFKGALPQLPQGKTQGSKGADDFVLRLGFIVKGKQKLTWLQRLVAPSWLKKMERLLPDNHGIKEVLFFTTCQQASLLNKKRNHYLDPTLKETCILQIEKEGPIQMSHQLKNTQEILGLWISTDGDDSLAHFQLNIHSIELNYK